jgi:hypothetical protein
MEPYYDTVQRIAMPDLIIKNAKLLDTEREGDFEAA